MEWLFSPSWWLAEEIPNWLFILGVCLGVGGCILTSWLCDRVSRR